MIPVESSRVFAPGFQPTSLVGLCSPPQLVGYMEVSMAMQVPQNGWFIRENPTKMDDFGVPIFWETPILDPMIQPLNI